VFSFDGMVQTIRGVLFVSKALSDENIPYLMTSRLNQDALENTFSLVRSANGNNSTQSVQEFGFTLAKLLSIKYTTAFTNISNCEEDVDSDIIRQEQEVQN